MSSLSVWPAWQSSAISPPHNEHHEYRLGLNLESSSKLLHRRRVEWGEEKMDPFRHYRVYLELLNTLVKNAKAPAKPLPPACLPSGHRFAS
jgi:hypothetical protein